MRTSANGSIRCPGVLPICCNHNFSRRSPARALCASCRRAVFGSHGSPAMMPCIVWGWADADEKVTVRIADQEKTTQADGAGKWRVTLEKIPAGAPQTLTVTGRNTLTVRDVLVGEVWLCSGQSNMGVPMSRTQNAEREIAAANDPQIRFVNVPFSCRSLRAGRRKPPARGKSARRKRSVTRRRLGYFFGRELQRQLNVPIGLIHSSVGGTAIEGWIKRETLDTVPELRASTDARLRLMASQPADIARFPAERDRWEERYHVRPPPNKGFAQGWADPAFDDHDWKTVAMPACQRVRRKIRTRAGRWLQMRAQCVQVLCCIWPRKCSVSCGVGRQAVQHELQLHARAI